MRAQHEFDLITAAQRDPRAFAALYERYVDLVWRYAMSRLRDPDRAADATSATFVQALAALPRFQPRLRGDSTSFQPWLMTIARNAVFTEIRREPSKSVSEDASDRSPLVDDAPTPEESALHAEEREHVARAMARLPESQRRIVELRLAGFRGDEIADALGMSVSAVNTAHHRAYRRLHDLLAEPAVSDRGQHERSR